jgi:uncharacterized pyridoxamine 5'-phosphate oxidase family protein
MDREKAIDYLQKVGLAYFATVEKVNDIYAPRVRAMAIIHHNNLVWAVTIGGRAKIAQLQANNNFELTALIPEDNKNIAIRARGTAEFIEDMSTKEELAKAISFFNSYWKNYDDPMFYLIKLNIEQLIFQVPSDVAGKPAFYTINL